MRRNVLLCSLLIVLAGVWISLPSSPSFALSPDDYFKIKVVDAETGRGVPLVELTTPHDLRYYTDSKGVAAIYEPGLMGKKVRFTVDSHGYEFSGGAGNGFKVVLEPGGSRTITVERKQVAERLYRVTGQGVFRDSVILGGTTPIQDPGPLLHDGKVMGQDSVVNAVYKDSLYWFWSDTILTRSWLGIFYGTGARSPLPGDEQNGWDPVQGVPLNYFLQDNESDSMAVFSDSGPVWLGPAMVVEDQDGSQRMFVKYSRIVEFDIGDVDPGSVSITDFTLIEDANPDGLAEWSDETHDLRQPMLFPQDMRVHFYRNPVRIRSDGQEWFYFTNPYSSGRVPTRPEALQDASEYEAFSPFESGTRWGDPNLDEKVVRDDRGDPVWKWRPRTPDLNIVRQEILIDSGILQRSEAIFHLRSTNSGQQTFGFGGTVYWNEYRQKWVMVYGELLGKTVLGEIWYAEADSPIGPWVYARKIITHDDYLCYLPNHHRTFDQNGGRHIFVECTYSANFLVRSPRTPRYNYNQIMYRVDLGDTRLHLPSPVYDHQDDTHPHRYDTLSGLENSNLDRPDSAVKQASVPFYALPTDRPRPNTVPVWEELRSAESGGDSVVALTLTQPSSSEDDSPVFYAYSPDANVENSAVVDVVEYQNTSTGTLIYRTSDPGTEWSANGPVFQAWQSPDLTPPIEPSAEPVKTCMGSSAVCD